MPYIFLRTAWMNHYKGVTDSDIPTGAGSYVEENQDGGEVNNFYPVKGFFYGYARIQNGRNLRIEKLGAEIGSDFLDDVTVVLFAKNPETGGQYIVGWYRNARLFREIQYLTNRVFQDKPYMVKGSVEKSFLVPTDERVKEVNGPGQTNAWYPEEYMPNQYFDDLESYMNDPLNYINRRGKRKSRKGVPWQKDIDLRKKVETEAMNAVYDYFIDRAYEVTYCHTENIGWDMEAISGKQTLLLEVKGLSGEFNTIELTANEYLGSKRNRKHYRICIVSNALNPEKQKLRIFYSENGRYVNKDNEELQLTEMTSARFWIKID